ncbi:mitotic spindle assembly checkpoint protein MAD1 [Diorhabda carinulata]|uniref:mitotic spindle assembly checkpoint protein MAD1 n=1 Tax=Diorhabda carinulata TaxID=1163345 RepID=UPI00259FF36B|nr:mitotic spindle assembly checkpoint protein MAD1 [Diorhabda carinulata]XP_057656109.1 mitotic spindle assembly checkpoint protein MAD1 [Diorhabda carinulata]
MTDHIDDTILNMVKDFKSTGPGPDIFFSHKRSSSSNSNESSYDDRTPAKKPKLDVNLDMSYVGSPREVRRMRADLLEARNIIKGLESRISHMHSVRKQMQLMFEEENKTLKRQNEYDKKSIEELESQLQTIRKREIELKHELAKVNNKYELLKINTNHSTDMLEKSLIEMKEANKSMECVEKGVIPGLERRIQELETMLEAAEEDAEAQKKLVEELGKRISEDNAIQRDLELKEQELLKARLYIKELEYAKESYREFQEQGKTQSQKLQRYAELEKENAQLREDTNKLKEQVKNKLILEEEVFDLKNRLAKCKGYEKKYADLQLQETKKSMELSEWRAVARGICESTQPDSTLPHLLRKIVERLQQQELTLTAEKVELESQVKAITYEARVAGSEIEKNSQLLVDLKQTAAQRQKLIHRLEKRLMLVTRERDSYRLQLDSYEKDLTMNPLSVGTSNAINQIQSQKKRIETLEKNVMEYRDLVTKLEIDLESAQPHGDRVEQLSKLKDEVQHLRLENDKLRMRRDELEIQLESTSRHENATQKNKVIHQVNNPLAESLSQREKYIEKLQSEIEKLKRKIKNMEAGIEQSKLGDITLSGKEITELKEQVKSLENKSQLLKDYFKSQMQEFRNVIYMLLGYKIDRTQNSLYKLRSMYAERPDDLLCFQVDKNGDLNLLENEFSANLESMINLHLRHQKSIPVFLSAITMDLFNNKTMTTKTIEQDD